MKTAPLGASALVTTRLAYGCWRIAGSCETGTEVSPERQASARRAILAAYEAGFRLFDHADIYSDGAAESIFGKVLHETPQIREHILIATKCGIRKSGEPFPESAYRYDSSAEHILKSCEGSLKRLRIETIDLYQLHRPDYLMNPEEVAKAFDQLKRSGKVREFGISNASPITVSLLQKFCPMKLLVNQVEISLMKVETLFDGTLSQCQAEGITPLAWSPLAAGRISSSGAIDLHEANHARRLKLRETLDLIGRDYGVSRSVVALAWLLKHPAGIVPIIGSTNPDNIRDAAGAADLELSRDEWYHLLQAALGQRLA